MKKLWIIPITLLLLNSCQWFERHRRGDIAAQVGDKVLYENDVRALVPIGISSEDSLRIVNQYIKQWATKQLLYQRAVKYSEQKEEFEIMVDNYRRQLYVHEFEQNMLQRRRTDSISDDSLQSWFATHHDLFRLNDNYVKGMFIIMPKQSHDINRLLQLMKEPTEDKMPDLEAIAIENSLGYSIFFDRWQAFSEIKLRLPLKTTDDSEWLKQNSFITLEDSTKTYILRVTEKIYSGDEMPLEIARPKVKDVMENGQRISTLKAIEQDLYNDGIKHGDIYLRETRTIEEQIAALPAKPVTIEKQPEPVNTIQQETINTEKPTPAASSDTNNPTQTKPASDMIPELEIEIPTPKQPEQKAQQTQTTQPAQQEQQQEQQPKETQVQQPKEENKPADNNKPKDNNTPKEEEQQQKQATFDFNIFD